MFIQALELLHIREFTLGSDLTFSAKMVTWNMFIYLWRCT